MSCTQLCFAPKHLFKVSCHWLFYGSSLFHNQDRFSFFTACWTCSCNTLESASKVWGVSPSKPWKDLLTQWTQSLVSWGICVCSVSKKFPKTSHLRQLKKWKEVLGKCLIIPVYLSSSGLGWSKWADTAILARWTSWDLSSPPSSWWLSHSAGLKQERHCPSEQHLQWFSHHKLEPSV